jgi:dienelactone hydrolase
VTSDVAESRLDLEVEGRRVPGVLWRPTTADGSEPLVLAGHGGGFGTDGHKRVDSIVRLARRLATAHGIATLAIDQPGCGDRDGAAEEQARRRRMTVQEAVASLWTKDLVEEMIGDWHAMLDHLGEHEGLGHTGVGYWGLSGGTTFGLPLVATERRISAAVLGLNGDVPLMQAYAPDVTCPVTWMMNLDDRFMTRDSCLALFERLGSEEKRVLAYPGDHGEHLDDAIPDWARWFADQLIPSG